ncbi:GMC family oxidoreductase N-terminal domain-containing protein [Paenibacillus sp. N4]|uniref:GMC oxidoreductase n=1 Tax=Paenibacillus vietnamensis TaxID=2590547 RepID=UPI001CD1611D|nr:GMC oxidoreductase [Paenibacillus vietnamensis]MCA0753732.1 GMC family oxidoreductase N-terminal domain-containing protein [Paenibacillus vietnamensis]
MRIRIAASGDTLRLIARSDNVDVSALIALNPHISDPDANVGGAQVQLPSSHQIARSFSTRGHASRSYERNDVPEWIPLTPLERMTENEYDVVIIGSGAGGAAVTWRLCERWRDKGKRVAVVEKGGLLLPTQVRNLPTMHHSRLMDYFHYVSEPVSGSATEFSGARQLFALGGKTLFWDTVSSRLDLPLLPEWPVPRHEMDTYYEIAERIMKVTKEYTEGAALSDNLLSRLHHGGFPEATRLPLAIALNPTRLGAIHSDVCFSSISLLAKALHTCPFDLTVRTCAMQVLTDSGKVRGVKVMSSDKRPYLLKAKNVVMSASTFETPRLLLHSGIQNRALGRYLTNQPFMLATGRLDRSEFPERIGTLAVYLRPTKDRPYQVRLTGPGDFWHSGHAEPPLRDELDFNLLLFGKTEPCYDNRIVLHPDITDEFGMPELKVHFSYHEADHAVIHQMAQGAKQIAAACGMRLVEQEDGQMVSLMPPGVLHHDSGTCRMGVDPSTSVTDLYGQVHGISGLYVADKSVLPYIGAGNPTLTTVALAIRSADHLIRTSE